mmetsp:Transcript_2455/g.5821  ORF Transcript_2455/g.5821 Transcript_2455/m.5821 type:complete len:216 (+) Transcript_2455:650-1297(+)
MKFVVAAAQLGRYFRKCCTLSLCLDGVKRGGAPAGLWAAGALLRAARALVEAAVAAAQVAEPGQARGQRDGVAARARRAGRARRAWDPCLGAASGSARVRELHDPGSSERLDVLVLRLVVVDLLLPLQRDLGVEVVVRDGVARLPVEAIQAHGVALLDREHEREVAASGQSGDVGVDVGGEIRVEGHEPSTILLRHVAEVFQETALGLHLLDPQL